MARHRHFQKDIGLYLGNTQLQPVHRQVQHEKTAQRSYHAHDGRHGDDPVHVPAHGFRVQPGVVVSDGHNGHVIEERQQDDHDRGDRVEVEHNHRQHHEDHDADGLGDTVNGVGIHAFEDAPGFLDSADDGGQTGRGENQVGGRARRVGGARNSDADIGLLERRGVVDTVAGHCHQVAALLQGLDDGILVLGEHLGETVGSLYALGRIRRRTPVLAIEQRSGRLDVFPQTEPGGDLTGDSGIVTGDHLYRNTVALGLADSLRRVLARRIEQRQDTEKLPVATCVHARHAQGAGTLRGVFIDERGGAFGGSLIDLAQLEDDLRRPLGYLERLAVAAGDLAHGALAHRVKGHEAGLGVTLQHRAIAQTANHSEVDGVLVFGPGSQRRGQDQLLCVAGCKHPGFAQGELVPGQRAGLVGTQNIDTGHLLD